MLPDNCLRVNSSEHQRKLGGWQHLLEGLKGLLFPSDTGDITFLGHLLIKKGEPVGSEGSFPGM